MPPNQKPKKRLRFSLKEGILGKLFSQKTPPEEPEPKEDKDPESRYFTACVQEDHSERVYTTRMPNGHIYNADGTLYILPPPAYTVEEQSQEEKDEQEKMVSEEKDERVETPLKTELGCLPIAWIPPRMNLTRRERVMLLVMLAVFLVYWWGWLIFVCGSTSIAWLCPDARVYFFGHDVQDTDSDA